MIAGSFLLASLVPLAAAQADGQAFQYRFDAPLALEADGHRIDVGGDIGHAGPIVRDFDGDGKRDLLVSSFRGTIEFFQNVGSDATPRYESRGKLKAVSESPGDLKFHNW